MKALAPGEAWAYVGDFGGGFLPGEEVAVAITVEHLRAGADGCLDVVRVMELLGDRTSGVIILVGTASGTLVMGHDR